MEALFQEFALASDGQIDQVTRDNQAAQDLYDRLLPHQQRFVDDKARRKSARCPRRAGKTFAVLYYAFIVALRSPGARIPIITLTQKSAKRNYWRLLRQLDTEMGLGLRFLDTTTEVFFPNGSYVFLCGAETLQEVEKLRGDQYDLAIVDECKSFSDRIFVEMLDDALGPALSDRRGTLVLIGTPGSVCSGVFYNATTPGTRNQGKVLICHPYGKKCSERFEWSFHTWTQADNTAVPAIWEEALRTKEFKGWSDDNPTWRREMLGEWTAGESAQVFVYADRIATGKVTWEPVLKGADNPFGLPNGHEWEYVLGLDLGFDDDTALVVLAYAPDHPFAYAVWDYRSNHLTATPLALIINKAQRMVGGTFAGMVADTGGGASKLLVETLNAEHGFHFDAAEKRDKFDHIELLNSDLFDGRLKLMLDSDLGREVEVLQWNLADGTKHDLARSGRLKYDARCQDHLSDAFLYAWRFLYHRQSVAKEAGAPPEGTLEWAAAWDKREREQAVARLSGEDDWLAATLAPRERGTNGGIYGRR